MPFSPSLPFCSSKPHVSTPFLGVMDKVHRHLTVTLSNLFSDWGGCVLD